MYKKLIKLKQGTHKIHRMSFMRRKPNSILNEHSICENIVSLLQWKVTGVSKWKFIPDAKEISF